MFIKSRLVLYYFSRSCLFLFESIRGKKTGKTSHSTVYIYTHIHSSSKSASLNYMFYFSLQSSVADVTESLLKVDQATVRDSYSVNSLLRIYTVLRAIKQTQASVERVHSRIEDRLLKSQCKTKQVRKNGRGTGT